VFTLHQDNPGDHKLISFYKYYLFDFLLNFPRFYPSWWKTLNYFIPNLFFILLIDVEIVDLLHNNHLDQEPLVVTKDKIDFLFLNIILLYNVYSNPLHRLYNKYINSKFIINNNWIMFT